MRALVLCAGFGTRLGHLTKKTPKPLLDAAGRPLVRWIIEHLARAGVTDILVNLNTQGDAIRDSLGDGSWAGLTIRYVEEPTLLGTAGTVRANRTWLAANGPFLVHYGDVVHDGSVRAFIARHFFVGVEATIALHASSTSNSWCELAPDGRVLRFLERPTAVDRPDMPGYAFSGLCILSGAAVDRLPHAPCDLPQDLFPGLATAGRLAGHILGGRRVAVDSPERLARLEALLRSGRCRPGHIIS